MRPVRPTISEAVAESVAESLDAATNSRDVRGGRVDSKGHDVWLPHAVRVVYEDDDIIIVDKPHGLLSATMPTQGDAPSVFSVVKEHIRGQGAPKREARSRATREAMATREFGQTQRSGIRVWIIHRLDREVSGLMVFAKNLNAFDLIKEELRVRRVQRSYVAIVEGLVGNEGEIGSVQSYLSEDDRGYVRSSQTPPPGVRGMSANEGRSGSGNRAGGYDSNDDGGKEARLAVTHYRVAKQAYGRTMLELKLDTGRKHQIRIHMRDLGFAIMGDARYGAKTDPIGRVCLHARTLSFAHPTSGAPMKFLSPTPGGLAGLIGGDAIANSDGDVLVAGIGNAVGMGKGNRTGNVQVPPKIPQLAMATGKLASSANPANSASFANSVNPANSNKPANASPTSWDHVAGWYEQHMETRGSDHHERVILPGTLRLLEVQDEMRILDVACGEGSLCRRIAEMGADVCGVDASPRLIGAAKKLEVNRIFDAKDPNRPRRNRDGGSGKAAYAVADATKLQSLTAQTLGIGAWEGLENAEATNQGVFDAACCVMALMNVSPLEPAIAGVARWLKPGGRFTAVILHPSFRSPGQTSWGWDKVEGAMDEASIEEDADGRDDSRQRDSAQYGSSQRGSYARGGSKPYFNKPSPRQYRRVDAYLSPMQREIVMNPGAVASGSNPVTTTTYHRPVQVYARAFAQAGLLIDTIEEWASARTSQPGPKAAEEDRARREIPMFMAIRAVRPG